MNRFALNAFWLFTFLLTFSNIDVEAKSRPKPAIYNIERLKELRQEYKKGSPRIAAFLAKADKVITAKPVSVMDKERSFVPDKHYYCSISRYAWPSEEDSTIYIIKDGVTNPEYKDFDLRKLELLRDRLKTLSVAFYITRDKRYYNAFVDHLSVWMLDEETYMRPNMMYSEVLPGSSGNIGMSYGLVELDRFTPIIESICLVQTVKTIDRRKIKKVAKWFEEMLSWTLNSEQWTDVSKKSKSNNIVAGLYVTLLEMARFTYNENIARKLGSEYKERILDVQIDEEGKQPAELKRTMGYGYSVGNLNNIVDFCLIMEQSGINFYKDNQQKIDSAFDYLFQFVGNQESFPYQQITGWDYCEKMLQRNSLRLSRMKSLRPYSCVQADYIIENETIMEYVY